MRWSALANDIRYTYALTARCRFFNFEIYRAIASIDTSIHLQTECCLFWQIDCLFVRLVSSRFKLISIQFWLQRKGRSKRCRSREMYRARGKSLAVPIVSEHRNIHFYWLYNTFLLFTLCRKFHYLIDLDSGGGWQKKTNAVSQSRSCASQTWTRAIGFISLGRKCQSYLNYIFVNAFSPHVEQNGNSSKGRTKKEWEPNRTNYDRKTNKSIKIAPQNINQN